MRNGQLNANDWFVIFIGLSALIFVSIHSEQEKAKVEAAQKYIIYYDNNVSNTTVDYLIWKVEHEAYLKIQKIKDK